MNNNKLVRNAIKIILLLVFLAFFQLLFGNEVLASTKTKEEIGQYIAEFSVNFQRDHGDEVVYCLDNYSDIFNGHRARAYIKGEKAHNGYYGLDCVGWVSMAIHYSTGLGSNNQFNYFVTPQNGACYSGDGIVFEQVGGKDTHMMPGDIIKSYDGNNWQHVMIYVGNGRIVHCARGLQNQLFTDSRYYYSPWTVYRINDAGVAAINDAELTTIYNGQGGITGEYNDDYETDSGFKYNGLATGTYSKYKAEWLVNSLKDILDWFVGISTYLTRMVCIGWTEVIEQSINNIAELTTGQKASLTIEKLVNNKVPILDVNFFNFTTAGGEEIKEESIMYAIRENIAVGYYLIRTLSIIGLLITLIYIGIRMAFSSVGEQKAKYKELLISWSVSFGIVFFIHYIMIIILNINNSLIELINISIGGGEESLYDSVRSSSYAIQASIGWPSLVIYVILVYLLVKFLFMYFKRFLVVGILTFMSPIIGVTYSIDKIKDNKAQSLSNWLKEYTFNVLLQSVHALLYTLFIGLAMNMVGDSITGSIIAILMIKFMLEAESIFKKIFGIKSGEIQDALKSSLAIMTGAKIAKSVAKSNLKFAAVVARPISKPIKEIENKTKQFKRSDKIEKVRKAVDEARESGNSIVNVGKNQFNIGELIDGDEQFDSLKIASKLVSKDETIKKAIKQQAQNMLSQSLNTALGTAETLVAIPMTIVEGEEGAAMLANAKSNLNKGINAANKNENYYDGKGRVIKNIVTGGAYKNIKNIYGEAKSYRSKSNNNVNNTQHEIIIKKLQKRINNEIRRLSKDSNINQEELAKIIEDANTIVSDDIILNVTCQIQASIGNEVLVKVSSKNGNSDSIYSRVDKMATEVADINLLHTKVKELTNMKERKVIDIDNNKFEKNVKAELITIIAKEKKLRKKDVMQSEVEKRFKNMSNKERSELMKKAMFKSTKLTDEVQKEKNMNKIKSNKTNMGLQNVNEIIDVMKETSKLPINEREYKNNVEKLIRKNISKKEKIGLEQIESSDIDKYIAGLSNKELIRIIKIAGAEENSLTQNRNANKPEYDKLVSDIKKLRQHKVQLKGTK